MDIEYPYAANADRLRLLYRLPTAPAPQRLLIVAANGSGASVGQGWPGDVTVVALAAIDTVLAGGPARFDAVALPSILGVTGMPGVTGLPGVSGVSGVSGASGTGNIALAGPAPRIRNSQLLAQVAGLLVPGGTLVGHMVHGWALRSIANTQGLRDVVAARIEPDAICRPADCLRALARAGFNSAECFYIQPSIDAPMGLIPGQRRAGRVQFLRAIRSARSGYSVSGYAFRLAMAGLGLGGMFQSQLFFWARKPC